MAQQKGPIDEKKMDRHRSARMRNPIDLPSTNSPTTIITPSGLASSGRKRRHFNVNRVASELLTARMCADHVPAVIGQFDGMDRRTTPVGFEPPTNPNHALPGFPYALGREIDRSVQTGIGEVDSDKAEYEMLNQHAAAIAKNQEDTDSGITLPPPNFESLSHMARIQRNGMMGVGATGSVDEAAADRVLNIMEKSSMSSFSVATIAQRPGKNPFINRVRTPEAHSPKTALKYWPGLLDLAPAVGKEDGVVNSLVFDDASGFSVVEGGNGLV